MVSILKNSYDGWVFAFQIVGNFVCIKSDEQLIVFMAENSTSISKKKISNQVYKKLDEWYVACVFVCVLYMDQMAAGI